MRQVFVAHLPEQVSEALAALPVTGRDFLLELLDDVWREQALPAAKALRRPEADGRAVSRERLTIWQHTPQPLMQELQDFSQFRELEDDQRVKTKICKNSAANSSKKHMKHHTPDPSAYF